MARLLAGDFPEQIHLPAPPEATASAFQQFRALVEQGKGSLPRVSTDHRSAWLLVLEAHWAHHLSEPMDVSYLVAMMKLSLCLRHWTLARKAGDALALRQSLTREECVTLAQARFHSGNPARALELLVTGLLKQPEDEELIRAHNHLSAVLSWRNQAGYVVGADWGDADLDLEPLGHDHLADFAWQYHDPAIAERCCLPTFESDAQWHRWLDIVYNCGDQKIYAVIHREWGFIGSVSLILHDGIGFFYYWFGTDFQGQGFGPRAVFLMLASAAERYGLHTCYAKVYEDNIPSRRALVKLGFEDIHVSAVAPDDSEMFYRNGPSADRGRIAEELHWLMAAMNSDTHPAILLRQKR